jgi:hypothetical protein
MLSRSVVTTTDVEKGKYDDWLDQFEGTDREEAEAINASIEEMYKREQVVNTALEAIRKAGPHMRHAEVHQVLITLACAMCDSKRFTEMEVANIEDTANDY